jgi:hypothetical protein
MGSRYNIYIDRHFPWLKYFTYHLAPVLTPNYTQHILLPAKLRKVFNSFMSNLFIWMYSGGGGAMFIKYFEGGGTSYKSWGTALHSGLWTCSATETP